MTRFTARVGTHNIRNTPDLPRAAVRKAAEMTAPRVDAVGFQELGEAEDHMDVRRYFTNDKWLWNNGNRDFVLDGSKILKNKGPGTECAMAMRRSKFITAPASEVPLGMEQFTTIQLTPGLHGVNPSRPLTLSFVRPVDDHGVAGPVTCLGDTHWANGVYSQPGQKEELWRQKMFAKQWEGTRDILGDIIFLGIPCVLVGDFNGRYFPRFFRDQKWAGGGGIDKIALMGTPAIHLGVTGPARATDTPSDHDLLVRPVYWEY